MMKKITNISSNNNSFCKDKSALRRMAAVLCIILVAVSSLFATCQVMAAENTKTYVIDDADILDDKEEAKLNKMCAKASKGCKTDIVIVTMIQGIDYGVMDEYTKNLLESDYGYNGSGTECDAICYTVDMVSRADRILALGTAKMTLEDRQLDDIRIESEGKLSDADYYGAFKSFVKNVERQLNQSISYKLTWGLPVKIIISAVVALVVVICMMFSAKSRMTVGGTTYTKDHMFNVNMRRDDFINTTVVTRHIEKSSSSGGGGGGGGGHSGSSGGHF